MRNLFIFAILLMVGCGSKTDDMFSDAREKLKEDKIIEAFDAYRKCITEYPDSPEGYKGLGNVYIRMGESDKAFKAFEQAIRIAPKDVRSYLERGHMWYNRKNYPEAYKDASKVIELESKNFEGFALRSKSLVSLGKNKDALDDISHAISLSPDVMNLYLDRAYLYFYTLKMPDNAKDDLNRALKCKKVGDWVFGNSLATTKALVYLLWAGIYKDSNDHINELKSYSDAIESDPTFSLPYSLRGDLYERFLMKKEAENDFAKAKELEEDEVKTNPYMRDAK